MTGRSSLPLAFVPEACTLPTVEQPLRLAEFDDLFATAVRRVVRVSRSALRFELDPTPAVAARTADLAARESACCAFFAFTLRIGERELALEVSVPDAHRDVLAALATRAETTARQA